MQGSPQGARSRPSYSSNAQRRMIQRGIGTDDVETVLTQFDSSRRRADGHMEYVGSVQGRRIKVVVDDQANPHRVVTAYDA